MNYLMLWIKNFLKNEEIRKIYSMNNNIDLLNKASVKLSAGKTTPKMNDSPLNFTLEEWVRFGGKKAPFILNADVGYRHLMNLEIYSILIGLVISDAGITENGKIEISQSVMTRDKYEFLMWLLDHIYPIVTSVEPIMRVTNPSNPKGSYCCRLNTISMFKVWEQEFYKKIPIVGRKKGFVRKKDCGLLAEKAVTNCLTLATIIACDGTRGGSMRAIKTREAKDNTTLIALGDALNVESYQKLFKTNFDLNSVLRKQGTTDQQLIFTVGDEVNVSNNLNQMKLWLYTRPFLTPLMQRKVIFPLKLEEGCDLSCIPRYLDPVSNQLQFVENLDNIPGYIRSYPLGRDVLNYARIFPFQNLNKYFYGIEGNLKIKLSLDEISVASRLAVTPEIPVMTQEIFDSVFEALITDIPFVRKVTNANTADNARRILNERVLELKTKGLIKN